MNKRLDKKKQQRKTETVQASAAVTPAAKTEVNFYIQYQDKEYLEKEIIAKVKEKYQAEGLADKDVKSLAIYLKPEDNKAYYTVDGGISGSVDL